MSEEAPVVFVVDDEESVRRALTRLLRSAGFHVAAFASAREFLPAEQPDAPGCIVLDLAMPGLNGLELQQTLASRGASRPIIFLTGRADIPMSVQAMKQGALDFLTKPVNDEDLLAAVRNALERDRINRRARAELAGIQRELAALTPREYQVMLQVVAGKLNKQIAAELGTGVKTIKVHRARVMEKTGVQSVAELVRLTERAGLPAEGRRGDRGPVPPGLQPGL